MRDLWGDQRPAAGGEVLASIAGLSWVWCRAGPDAVPAEGHAGDPRDGLT
jgi:hypothetical protein